MKRTLRVVATLGFLMAVAAPVAWAYDLDREMLELENKGQYAEAIATLQSILSSRTDHSGNWRQLTIRLADCYEGVGQFRKARAQWYDVYASEQERWDGERKEALLRRQAGESVYNALLPPEDELPRRWLEDATRIAICDCLAGDAAAGTKGLDTSVAQCRKLFDAEISSPGLAGLVYLDALRWQDSLVQGYAVQAVCRLRAGKQNEVAVGGQAALDVIRECRNDHFRDEAIRASHALMGPSGTNTGLDKFFELNFEYARSYDPQKECLSMARGFLEKKRYYLACFWYDAAQRFSGSVPWVNISEEAERCKQLLPKGTDTPKS